jgi:hypothetical protein
MKPLANVTPETPVGTPVLYVDGLYKLFFTQTRSKPWESIRGQWTVLIAGRTGGYSLERLFVFELSPPAKEEGPKPLCADLRHVCGKCGFQWPERAEYDRLIAEHVRLQAEIEALWEQADKK